ncbi:hypothetical protein TREMEDRAFT_58526 [Tremella mesenterica DSM 1558]|uniref:uncharacterized protein n=1 Tax=Tremella mesenterica (strain ATCC 24925 / CBS 8224 / DSM 1558 / NBRC 9311 / NRRL Y-6157 / RJB 2259-6 / UBC 559-6) TaxID=578456 RepID=UPI0003F49BE7|nr:uncharacterized protein TREMEDRAFT_58526 [Tremella mesenterica DSM 1558]EIW72359.1 hypothetical protein TREMEDRAFT_58526 [Tremella mesenterica DSM 1558]
MRRVCGVPVHIKVHTVAELAWTGDIEKVLQRLESNNFFPPVLHLQILMMAAPQAYCYVNPPLLLQLVTAPNSTHPYQLTFGLSIDCINSNTHHPVAVHFWTINPPVIDKVVDFWGSLAHNGSSHAPLMVFATSVERFQWANLDAKNYMSLVPKERRPMIIAQGTV